MLACPTIRDDLPRKENKQGRRTRPTCQDCVALTYLTSTNEPQFAEDSGGRRTRAIRARIDRGCVVVTEAGSYLRLIDFCITQLKAQGPSRTCDESKEEEETKNRSRQEAGGRRVQGSGFRI